MPKVPSFLRKQESGTVHARRSRFNIYSDLEPAPCPDVGGKKISCSSISFHRFRRSKMPNLIATVEIHCRGISCHPVWLYGYLGDQNVHSGNSDKHLTLRGVFLARLFLLFQFIEEF